MKPFHSIAVPHKDILEGRLTMNVFAADLWNVSQGRGPDEYKDADMFFQKTYNTQGLKNLLKIVEKRLRGEGGDPVIQLQTPFGGGKTHSLIAMYHKAEQWNANTLVAVGTVLGKKDTLWGLMEKQLTGKTKELSGRVSPGREAIHNLLSEHEPVLILLDEVLEYVTKASGVKVGDSTLAAQTLAFIHELTETVSTLEKACLVITLPSSDTEHYDEKAEKVFQELQKEKLFQKVQKVSGRIEKVFTPVQENEIAQIIRRRLFSNIDLTEAENTVKTFLKYVEKGESPACQRSCERIQGTVHQFLSLYAGSGGCAL